MRGLVCVQILAGFNTFLGSDSKLFKTTMSELFHNLSIQALTVEDGTIQIQ